MGRSKIVQVNVKRPQLALTIAGRAERWRGSQTLDALRILSAPLPGQGRGKTPATG